MRRLFRTLLKIAGLIPTLQVGSAVATEPPAPVIGTAPQVSASTFIKGLAADPALRARFAANPQQVLREAGLDAAAYGVPHASDEIEVERVLASWLGPSGPSLENRVPDVVLATMAQSSPSPPAVVYGPPARPPSQEKTFKPPSPRPPERPPAPVYGPPPGLRKQ